jgi:hypothetical protein
MSNLDRTNSRVDQAISEGQLWRAKEILQSNIRTQGYVPELYERYGQVLLEMCDLVEAGKYLFLSGKRDPAYERAISLYVARFTRRDPLRLYHSFPTKAKLAVASDYPRPVAETLRALGLPESLPQPRTYPSPKRSVGSFWSCLVLGLLGLAAFGGCARLIWDFFAWIRH